MSNIARQRDLTQGPVAKTLFLFALPSLGVNILQSMNGSVNAVFVGRFLGEKALAATANANLILFLLYSTMFGFAMATTILIGQAMGRRDIEDIRRTLGAAVAMFACLGIACAALGWIFAPNILHLLATPAPAFPLALTYLRVIFLGMPFAFLGVLLSSAMRGVGDAVTPLWNTILTVALDAGLNPILILGLGPIPAMGIAGSALATLLATLISLMALVWQIYRRDIVIRLKGAELRWLRPSRQRVGIILGKGMPMGLSMIVMSLSSLVMIGLINREGVDMAAAYGVMTQLWSYAQMPAIAVGSAVSAMAAQNIGAGNWSRLNHVAWAGIGINVAMTATLLGLITLAVHPLTGFFLPTGSPAIALAAHINLMIGWTFVLMGISMVVGSVVRANGAVIMPFIILVLSAVVMRFVIGFWLYPFWGADAIWAAFAASAVTSAVLSLAYYLHGGWRRARMIAA